MHGAVKIAERMVVIGIKNKERPLGEIKWAWHRKSRGE